MSDSVVGALAPSVLLGLPVARQEQLFGLLRATQIWWWCQDQGWEAVGWPEDLPAPVVSVEAPVGGSEYMTVQTGVTFNDVTVSATGDSPFEMVMWWEQEDGGDYGDAPTESMNVTEHQREVVETAVAAAYEGLWAVVDEWGVVTAATEPVVAACIYKGVVPPVAPPLYAEVPLPVIDLAAQTLFAAAAKRLTPFAPPAPLWAPEVGFAPTDLRVGWVPGQHCQVEGTFQGARFLAVMPGDPPQDAPQIGWEGTHPELAPEQRTAFHEYLSSVGERTSWVGQSLGTWSKDGADQVAATVFATSPAAQEQGETPT